MRKTITLLLAGAALVTCTTSCKGKLALQMTDDGSSGVPGGGETVRGTICEDLNVGYTPLRRVTRADFTSAVEDLVGVDASRFVDLPADELAVNFVPANTSQPVSVTGADLYHEASEEVAQVVDLDRVVPCDLDAAECPKAFVEAFATLAYRRPLSEEEVEGLVALHTATREASDAETAYRTVISTVLQSPFFLYYVEASGSDSDAEVVPLSQLELAARLAAFIWNSVPDEALMEKARSGELATHEEVAATAREMLADPRARRVVSNFHLQWLEIADLQEADKSRELYPEADAEFLWAMEQETRLFVEHVLFEGDGRLGTLLTADYTFVNRDLAEHYGLDADALFGTAAEPTEPVEERALSINFIGSVDGSIVRDWEGHAPDESFGVVGSPQWNQAAGAGGRIASLTRDDGESTSAAVRWGAEGTANGTTTGGLSREEIGGDGRMMAGSIYSLDAAVEVNVDGLDPDVVGPTYDVYVYYDGSNKMKERRTAFSIGTTERVGLEGDYVDGGGNTRGHDFLGTFGGEFVEGSYDTSGNYVVFRGVSGRSFRLVAKNHASNFEGLEVKTDTQWDLGAVINGIQIVGRPEAGDGPSEFRRVDLPPGERLGLLTHGSFLAAHAHRDVTSPVKRGTVILENMVRCVPFPSPDELDVDTALPARTEETTTRQQIHDITIAGQTTCAGCHIPINHVGYAFEHYDAVGGWRETDGSLPVDATTDLGNVPGLTGSIDGAPALVQQLAESESVAHCVSRQWLRYALRRPDFPADSCSLEHVSTAFRESNYDVRELLVAITTTDAFRFRRTAPDSAAPSVPTEAAQ